MSHAILLWHASKLHVSVLNLQSFATFDGTPDVKCEGLNNSGWFKESVVHGNQKIAQLKCQVSLISSWISRCLSNVKTVRFMWRRSCLILTCLHPYWFTSAWSRVALSFSHKCSKKCYFKRRRAAFPAHLKFCLEHLLLRPFPSTRGKC